MRLSPAGVGIRPRKREAVLKTAAELFLEKSYSRGSMNDVAERLTVTKPALYHYFQNKEQPADTIAIGRQIPKGVLSAGRYTV